MDPEMEVARKVRPGARGPTRRLAKDAGKVLKRTAVHPDKLPTMLARPKGAQ